MMIRKTLCSLLVFFCLPAWGAEVPTPVATDSRIKTFVYSENDVFNVVTHYGYESNIEFGLQEQIETISVGDRIGFQIVPAGRRLFIRAMSTSARTNMTVVTTKHAYQFDLTAVPMPVSPNEELAYVVRFFYPDDKKNIAALSAAPVSMASMDKNISSATTPSGGMIYNYNYTFTGSDSAAPLKVFDDGNSTYFKLRSDDTKPRIALVNAAGKEKLLTSRHEGEYWVVDNTSARFTIRMNGALVCVYNEKMSR
jgi:type IV secretion system protein VirB9